MKRHVVLAVIPLLAGALSACQTPPPPAPAAPAAAPAQSPVERGRYIVTAGVCNDCHTPFKMGPNGPEPDMDRMLSGHPESIKVTKVPTIPNGWGFMGSPTNTAWAGPWGVSFSANITPDENTGIGIWTEDMFIRALREGKHMGQSRPILPPMPWMFIGKYSDDDLKAIFAYLKSIKPISNHVPDPLPPPGAGK
jgi:cytochrome c553